MSKDGLQRMCRVLEEKDGQDVLEYALAAALIGVGAIVCLHGLSSTYNWLVYIGASIISGI